MHLIKPTSSLNKQKWDIRVRNHDGRVVKIPGDRDKQTARRIGERVEMLIRARQQGDAPPPELRAWIEGMPQSLADRLIELGLLHQRQLERAKPLEEHINTYGKIVAGRRSNKARHSSQQENKVRRVCEGVGATKFSELTARGLLDFLSTLKIATSTRRGYIIAMKDFGYEMIRLGVAVENPYEWVDAPGAYENPEYERQPLTVEQFRSLMKYMSSFVRYKGQNARWTAHDRKMLYWTAVRTGYRQSELRALRKLNLHLDGKPAVISLKAKDAKNKTAGEVPIPSDLAAALKKYAAQLEPEDRVFPMPITSGSIVDMFRRDLKGAGIEWRLPGGEVIDFHALRSTAITWWLDEDGLSPKRVQILARLKTLALVQRYSRNLRIEDLGWLDKGPKLVSPRRAKRAG
jgi:integrase